MRKFKVTYKDGRYIGCDTWYAENKIECKKVARDDYKNSLDDFRGILRIEEIK